MKRTSIDEATGYGEEIAQSIVNQIVHSRTRLHVTTKIILGKITHQLIKQWKPELLKDGWMSGIGCEIDKTKDYYIHIIES